MSVHCFGTYNRPLAEYFRFAGLMKAGQFQPDPSGYNFRRELGDGWCALIIYGHDKKHQYQEVDQFGRIRRDELIVGIFFDGDDEQGVLNISTE